MYKKKRTFKWAEVYHKLAELKLVTFIGLPIIALMVVALIASMLSGCIDVNSNMISAKALNNVNHQSKTNTNIDVAANIENTLIVAPTHQFQLTAAT